MRENASADPADIEIFTAQVLYEYLENSCAVENVKLIEGHRAKIKKMYHKARQTPLVYLRAYFPFIHEINQLTDRPLTDAEEERKEDMIMVNVERTQQSRLRSTGISERPFDLAETWFWNHGGIEKQIRSLHIGRVYEMQDMIHDATN